MKQALLLLMLQLAITAANAAAQPDSITRLIFEEIYNQHYARAHELIEQNESIIDSLQLTVLKIDLLYRQFITGTETPDYPRFETELNAFNCADTLLPQQKTQRLIFLSYRLRYELKRYRFFKAIKTQGECRELFKLLRPLQKQLSHQEQQFLKLYSALILYFDNYLKRYYFANDSQQQQHALSHLENLTQSNELTLKTLSMYFLGKIYLKYEKTPKQAYPLFKWLTARYPDNRQFRELLARCE